MSFNYDVLDQTLSEAIQVYVARVDAYLQTLGPIGLQDIALSRRLNIGTIRYELTVQYTTPGTATFRAAYFAEKNDADLDAAVDAFFAAIPTARIQFVKDVSQEVRRNTIQNAVLVLYIDSVVPNCGADRGRPVIIQAVAEILPGATGTGHIVSSSGLQPDLITITNRSQITWPAGEMGYAAADVGSCAWFGFPTCCS